MLTSELSYIAGGNAKCTDTLEAGNIKHVLINSVALTSPPASTPLSTLFLKQNNPFRINIWSHFSSVPNLSLVSPEESCWDPQVICPSSPLWPPLPPQYHASSHTGTAQRTVMEVQRCFPVLLPRVSPFKKDSSPLTTPGQENTYSLTLLFLRNSRPAHVQILWLLPSLSPDCLLQMFFRAWSFPSFGPWLKHPI